MRKITLFLFITSALTAMAQNPSTIETRALIDNFAKTKSVNGMSETLLNKYPIRYDKGVACIGVIAKVDNSFSAEKIEKEGIKVTSRVADIVSMRVPLAKLQLLEQWQGINVFSVAHRVAPDMNKTRFDTRTDSVQAGLGIPMPLNGEGVLIGITDWGFDYTHPNLNTKSKKRILKAWDHFKLSGPAPQGFDYGTEYTGYDELKAAKGDTSGLYGYGTHGTHVAGICGGNGINGNAIGQAPEAMFLLGSWYLDEASWLDQVAWMKSVADEEHKRLVINSSWGMYTFSTLDGTSLLSQGIDAYADSGIVFVTSGGNNGDANYHLKCTFTSDSTVTSIASYLSSGVGQALIYWGEPGTNNQFSAGFAMVSNSDPEVRYYSPMYATSDNVGYLESYILAGNDTVWYDIMTESANPLDGRPHALLNVSRLGGYKIMMICSGSDGAIVNIWNVGNVLNHAGNTGCDFENAGVFGCQNGDKYYGIGEPGCANGTMTVAAHAADRYSSDSSSVILGELTYFSSYGPTLDGRAKPDISAPGSAVVSSISSWADNGNEYEAVYSTVYNGRGYKWSSMSGTSMSSPAVTGIVALMLQANPHLTFEQIHHILTSTARNDSKTGQLHANDSISIRWGWGKVDALRAVGAAFDLLDINEAVESMPELVVFPNPSTDKIIVRTCSNKPETMTVYTVDGRNVMQCNVTGESTVDISHLPNGVYIVRVADTRGIRTAKLVKN